MKVIFLDIDGVLCMPKQFYPLQKVILAGRRVSNFDEDCLRRLDKIIEATGAMVVISSAWRIDFWEPAEFDLLKEHFKNQGSIVNLIGHTPYDNERIRGREIQTWLNEHPDVEKFIIIDDSDDMEHLMPRLIRTKFYDGIQDEHVEMAIKMLKE